jgi:N-acetylglutamate synthase-like GNAT family acetyltransferase
MNGLSIRASRPADLPVVLGLLREARLPEDIEPHFESFLIAESSAAVVGTVGLEEFGSRVLLRSLVVVPSWRAKGVGRSLAREIVAQARSHGSEEIFLLTLDAGRFFERLGFRDVDRADVPADVRTTREFRELCPGTARVMKLAVTRA